MWQLQRHDDHCRGRHENSGPAPPGNRVHKIPFGHCFSCGNLHNVSGLGEIQEAIEKLAPDERARLLDWLESLDSDLEKESSKRGQSTILDSFNPSFDSRVGLPFQLCFESTYLLADVCRTPHIKAIGNPALTQRGRTCYGPGQTHLARFASLGRFELVLAKRKRLQSPSN
jgi:hypothetical protein